METDTTPGDDTPDTGTEDKGAGRGRGRWTAKGVQAQQSSDIEELKAIVAELVTRLEELEPDTA